MKSARILLGLVLALIVIGPVWGFAQPKIPKANIPADIPEAVKKEIEQLYSKDPVQRGYATLHLKGMGGRGTPAVPFLVAMLGEQVDLQRTENQGGGRLFWEPSVSIGALAGEALGAMGDPGINALLTSLKNDNANIRANAARGLGEGKAKRAVEPLILALSDKSSLVRRWAVYALGEIKDDRAVEPLLLALKDKSGSVRRSAIYGLSKFKANGISEALILALIKDPDKDVRTAAAGSLGELKHPGSVKPLISALKDKNSEVRTAAAGALGEIKDKQALYCLIPALKDKVHNVQSAAASALGNIKDFRAVPQLIEMIGDKAISYDANRALNNITGKDFGNDADKWKKWWEESQGKQDLGK